jgi:hypothetical protein
MTIPAISAKKLALEWLAARIRWIAMGYGVFVFFFFLWHEIVKRTSHGLWVNLGIAAIAAIATIFSVTGFLFSFYSIYIRVQFPGATLSQFLDSRRKVVQPPGTSILSAARFLCTKKTSDRVVKPAIADMRHEYCEAMAEGSKLWALWIRVRGTFGLLLALGLYRLTKTLWDVWRSVK